jgi:hypothetical protein
VAGKQGFNGAAAARRRRQQQAPRFPANRENIREFPETFIEAAGFGASRRTIMKQLQGIAARSLRPRDQGLSARRTGNRARGAGHSHHAGAAHRALHATGRVCSATRRGTAPSGVAGRRRGLRCGRGFRFAGAGHAGLGMCVSECGPARVSIARIGNSIPINKPIPASCQEPPTEPAAGRGRYGHRRRTAPRRWLRIRRMGTTPMDRTP